MIQHFRASRHFDVMHFLLKLDLGRDITQKSLHETLVLYDKKVVECLKLCNGFIGGISEHQLVHSKMSIKQFAITRSLK